MSVIQSIILGLVQGVTEFLPVSSSAHLLIFRKLLHVTDEQAVLFNILLHIGTITAVVVSFSRDLKRLLLALCGIAVDVIHNFRIFLFEKNSEQKEYRKLFGTNYRRLALCLTITMIPTALIGCACIPLVELMSGNLLAPGVGLYLTALMLTVADMLPDGKKTPKNMKAQDAFLAGVFQGFSSVPGLSRLGTTISSCVIGGMSRTFAIKYSILASVPAVFGALIVELIRMPKEETVFLASYIPGIIVSAVAGFLSIRLLLRIVRNRKLKLFAVYCLLVGTLSIAGYYLL
ncbi:MAG: undecaprenyl-diphosphate phosphatase [Fusicatenibacter sp.]